MAENTLQKLRQRFSNTTPLTSSSAESAMRSLELVRIAVQAAFDKEVDEMVKHFIEVIEEKKPYNFLIYENTEYNFLSNR